MSAVLPAELSKQRGSSELKGPSSHGRGGAGNIGSTVSDFDPVTYNTPILTGERYTTGRGGSGNIAENTDPAAARRAQDVDFVPLKQTISASHVGRGGAGNVEPPASMMESDHERKRREEAEKEAKAVKGLAARGKEWLMGKRS